jgi:predicted transcriptional regulator
MALPPILYFVRISGVAVSSEHRQPEIHVMARPASSQPTEGELEILRVLWEGGPSELKQVCAGLRRNRPVATTTVATMLRVMQEKRLVDRHEGENARASVWSARVTRAAASTTMLKRLLDLVFDGSARGLVAHMVETGKLSERDRREIRRLLDDGTPEPKRNASATPRTKGGPRR